MPDHIRGVGTGDEMLIRDLGMANGHVEFWFHSDANTWNNQQDWGYNIGGGYVGGVFKLEKNGAWHHLGTVHVPTRRNVTMRIVDEGLGWPTTDFTVFIERARRPDPPGAPYYGHIDHDTIHAGFDHGYDGGMAIDAHEMWYSDDPNNAKWLIPNTNNHWFEGLSSGVLYHFWGKVHNPMGWSDLSARTERRTHRVPYAPTIVSLSSIKQESIFTSFRGINDGGSPIIEWQLGYGKNPDAAEVLVQANTGDTQLNDLDPGKKYYFWARGRNAVGWGPWSARTEATLDAGAFVRHTGTWRRAVPYVKVNGVWTLAKPWTKAGGTWRETKS